MRVLLTASIGAVLVAVVGCGNNPTAPTPTPTPAPPISVSAVSVTSGSTLASAFQMTATARLSDGTTQDVTRTATWDSSNSQVATVSAGMVTVLGSGELDIRATYQSVSGSMHVLVGRIPAVSLSISGVSTANNFQLTATARLSDGTTQNVTSVASWDSSNTQVVTVSPTGLVTVVGNGAADVRVAYQGLSDSAHLVFGSSQTFVMTGTIREAAPNSRPIAGALVRLLGESISPIVSNDQGMFTIPGVPPGRVIIEVTKSGYQVWNSDAVIDRDVNLQIVLTPTPLAATTAAAP